MMIKGATPYLIIIAGNGIAVGLLGVVYFAGIHGVAALVYFFIVQFFAGALSVSSVYMYV